MSGLESIESLKTELRKICDNLAKLRVDVQEAEEEGEKTRLGEEIKKAETSQSQLKDKLVQHILDMNTPEIVPLSSKGKAPKTKAEVPSASASSSSSTTEIGGRDSISDRDSVSDRRRIKLKQPKEYKKGEDFALFGHRFQIFVQSNRTDPDDYSNALLSCVDDITLQKLMPVIQGLTDGEKRNLKTLLNKCRDTLYPRSEIRALRQQLTSAKMVQETDEDVEAFAARIRSVVNKAGYSTEEEKSETCLNAFLNGLNSDLVDKLYAAPDVEDNFEVAVSTARKLEKMQGLRKTTSSSEVNNMAHVFKVSEPPRGSRVQSQGRSAEQHQLLSDVSEYRRSEGATNDSYRRSSMSQRGRPANRGRQGRERNENRTCHRCGIQGHIARFCRAPLPLNM